MVLGSTELHQVFKTMGMLSLLIGKHSVLSDEEQYAEENPEDTILYMNSRTPVSLIIMPWLQLVIFLVLLHCSVQSYVVGMCVLKWLSLFITVDA